MFSHDLQVGGGIHPKLGIEVEMVLIIHAGQFDMLRAVLQYALFDLLEEPFPISLVLILRQDNDLLQVLDRDIIIFLEVSDHKPGRMMRVIRLDQTEGILDGDH